LPAQKPQITQTNNNDVQVGLIFVKELKGKAVYVKLVDIY